jgi:uncharacterized membrane protein (UPF0127 family)
MSRIFKIFLIVLIFIFLILFFWLGQTFLSTQTRNPSDITVSENILGTDGQVKIKNGVWQVKIVVSEEVKKLGLSNRTILHPNNGMLFVFDKIDAQNFWMKDMLIPIDMIFFDDNWEIVLIEENISPNTFPKTFGGSVKSKYVLEMNAGEALSAGLKVGDRAIFLNK